MSNTQPRLHENMFARLMARLHRPPEISVPLGIGSYGPLAGPEHRLLARIARHRKEPRPLPLTEERMAAIRQAWQ